MTRYTTSLNEKPEAELVGDARNGNREVVAELFRRQYPHSIAVARRMLPAKQFGHNFSVPDRKSTRLNSSHQIISYAVFCLKKKKKIKKDTQEIEEEATVRHCKGVRCQHGRLQLVMITHARRPLSTYASDAPQAASCCVSAA